MTDAAKQLTQIDQMRNLANELKNKSWLLLIPISGTAGYTRILARILQQSV